MESGENPKVTMDIGWILVTLVFEFIDDCTTFILLTNSQVTPSELLPATTLSLLQAQPPEKSVTLAIIRPPSYNNYFAWVDC